MFQGVNLGRSHPNGKITLPVTFGEELNFQTERIVFDVVDLPLPYNGILGRPTLAKFMVASVRTPTQCHIDLACNTSYHFAASRTVFPRVSPYLCPGPFAPFGTRI